MVSSPSGAPPSAVSRALAGVDQALDAPRRPGIPLGNWRWVVRQRMTGLREALTSDSGTADDGWLAARGGAAFRERNELLARVGALGAAVLDAPDVEQARAELKRLLADIHAHLQRLQDQQHDQVLDP